MVKLEDIIRRVVREELQLFRGDIVKLIRKSSKQPPPAGVNFGMELPVTAIKELSSAAEALGMNFSSLTREILNEALSKKLRLMHDLPHSWSGGRKRLAGFNIPESTHERLGEAAKKLALSKTMLVKLVLFQWLSNA